MALQRDALRGNHALTGTSWCAANSDLIDAWLDELLTGPAKGIALVAVGGYGRRELCPESDIDVMLVHERRDDVSQVADRIWYPIWDAGLHLGHSVATVREAVGLMSDELDSATALLSVR